MHESARKFEAKQVCDALDVLGCTCATMIQPASVLQSDADDSCKLYRDRDRLL